MAELRRMYPEPKLERMAESEEAAELEIGMYEFLDRLHEMHRVSMFKLFDLTAAGIQEKEVADDDPKYLRRLKDEVGRHCRAALLRTFEDLEKAGLITGNVKDEYGVALAPGIIISDDAGEPIGCDLEAVIRNNYLGKTTSLIKAIMTFAEYVWGGKAESVKQESPDGVMEIKPVLSARAMYFATGANEILEEQVEEYLARLEADRVLKDHKLNDMVRGPDA